MQICQQQQRSLLELRDRGIVQVYTDKYLILKRWNINHYSLLASLIYLQSPALLMCV